ncbi:peptidase domain-containing ABC transporter [Chitinophaga flava]|uniref:ABC transporter ATP-binding protein n=1 Tax=Chitinophaga flava TaxID=2259036 RepID=A0A365XUJ6_9BACT|nr:peptidase domain-containing ABC transporter [Chitinophaga flava]RBL90046.1 ABC transporter ATP-binding protein [Chitinophaga flava]
MFNILKNKFRTYRQLDSSDCGITCIKMIASHFGKNYPLSYFQQYVYKNKLGVNFNALKQSAAHIGLSAKAVRISTDDLFRSVPLPCILHWNQNHFVVLPPQDLTVPAKGITIADPARGLIKIDYEKFLANWIQNASGSGYAMIFQPTETFHTTSPVAENNKSLIELFRYVSNEKKRIWTIMLCILLEASVALSFPFLTRKLFDAGVIPKNTAVINLVILSQLGIFMVSLTARILRGWQLLFLNTRIIQRLLSDYLTRLMKLPVSFFDSRKIGDITQRIADHDKIEAFLTSGYFTTMLSIVSLLIYTIVLGLFNLKILGIFMLGSFIAIIWIVSFLKNRKRLDYQRFEMLSESQTSLVESINGIYDVKVFDSNVFRVNSWNRLQVELYKINVKILKISQFQLMGSIFFSQTKNILISLLAAYAVVNGELSIGGLMSITFIIAQMNSPIENLLDFLLSSQEAKISLERLTDSRKFNTETEEYDNKVLSAPNLKEHLKGSIQFSDVYFSYTGNASGFALSGISLDIAPGSLTAIVGASGSGKSTLLKLLLRFYNPGKGAITINDANLSSFDPVQWRTACGVVLQEGFIFSDTVARNITMSDESANEAQLALALRLSLSEEFVDQLPLKQHTKIGGSGIALSSGQKQRILIARAIYKNPDFIFFDEATSALDSTNEKLLMRNILDYFKGKTMIIIAHRLSTVREADQIYVLKHGTVVETGNHETLIANKGRYFELVKNQLELDIS